LHYNSHVEAILNLVSFINEPDAKRRFQMLTLHKSFYLFIRGRNKRVGMSGRCWMLDTGYWILRNAPGVRFRNIQNPVSRIT
jgi:hypothetical protein